MWGPSKSPAYPEFYEDMQRNRHTSSEDWAPMIQAVRDLQTLPVADRLYAFTSLAHFQITTAPTYEESQSHSFIRFIWDCYAHRFRISYGRCKDGWLDLPFTEHVRSDLMLALHPLIDRLILDGYEAGSTQPAVLVLYGVCRT
jgi:hypothetical protein